MATPEWGQTKLRVAHGDIPDPGTVLLLASGRRYQVLRVGGRTLHVLVLPKDHDTEDAPVWTWAWTPRKRKGLR